MTKKKKKGKVKKNVTKRLIKQLKKVIKIHGTELAVGFVTGLITQLIADKTINPKNPKKNKEAKTKEQPSIITAVEETTKAVADKVKSVVAPKKSITKKVPAQKATFKPKQTAYPVTETTA